MTDAERIARLNDLHRKLARREGNPIYRENVKALREEIARLEADSDEADT